MRKNTTVRIKRGTVESSIIYQLKLIDGTNHKAFVERHLTCGNKHYIVIAFTNKTPDVEVQNLIDKVTNTLRYLPSRNQTYGGQKVSTVNSRG